jgi:hypothetical protein
MSVRTVWQALIAVAVALGVAGAWSVLRAPGLRAQSQADAVPVADDGSSLVPEAEPVSQLDCGPIGPARPGFLSINLGSWDRFPAATGDFRLAIFDAQGRVVAARDVRLRAGHSRSLRFRVRPGPPQQTALFRGEVAQLSGPPNLRVQATFQFSPDGLGLSAAPPSCPQYAPHLPPTPR